MLFMANNDIVFSRNMSFNDGESSQMVYTLTDTIKNIEENKE